MSKSNYIKCEHCNEVVKTQVEFNKQLKNGEWHIAKIGCHWDYVHNCDSSFVHPNEWRKKNGNDGAYGVGLVELYEQDK